MTVKTKRNLRTILFHGCAILIGFIMFYPLLWMIMSSFKDNTEIFVNAHRLWPTQWAIVQNYISGWDGVGFVGFDRFMLNSLIVTTVGTAGNLICSVLAAFAFTRIKFKFSRFLFGCVLVTMMIPSQVMVVPQYIILHRLNFIDTYAALVAPWFFGGGFFIFLLVQFLRGIPIELDEAAEIDGCSKIQTMLFILLPNILPAIVTAAIFSFYWIWSDFFQPLIFTTSPRMFTVPLGLRLFLDPTTASNYGGMFAMSVVSLMPIIIFFVIFQKHLVEGIATTGLKG